MAEPKRICRLLKEAFGPNREGGFIRPEKTDVKFHDDIADRPGDCYVDFAPRSAIAHIEKRGCETQSHSSLYYSEGSGVLSGDIVVTHCPRKSGERISPYILFGRDAEFCGSPTMVHVHGGECPTTHIHVENDLRSEPNYPHCIRKIADFVGRKLTDYADATCV